MTAVRFLFFLALLIFPTAIFAQNDEEAAKEKIRQQTEFLEQVLGDAKNLRLPENRAFVFGKVGNALWQTDEKRARQLFQDAITDLIAAQTEAATEKNGKQWFGNLIYGQSPRWEILYMLANRDADFALEAMVRTRPPKLNDLLAGKKTDYQTQTGQYVNSENQNEQRLLGIAAQQNPERAVKLLRESLKKGVNYETFGLVRQIFEKNEKTGNELAEEVGQKILEMPLDETNRDSSLLQSFLTEFARPPTPENKSAKISDALIRSLSDKVLKFLLAQNNSIYVNDSAFKIIEKFSPAAVAQVRQKQAKLQEQNQNMSERDKDYSRLMQNDVSADELLSQVGKFQSYQRTEIYQRAAQKIAQSGNISQARNILSDNLPDEEADRYLSQFDYNAANQAAAQGNFAEVNALINQISDENLRLSALINLASAIYQKNPKENQSQAAAVLDQARAILPDTPENLAEINSLLGIASNYVQIDAAQAFRLTESVVPALNEFSEASAVLAKFNSGGNFRQGEFQINTNGNFLRTYNLTYLLQRLKAVDFGRAVQLTKNFNRLDVRLALQLQIIDSISELPINGFRRGFGNVVIRR